jgi:tetratricopeptide (TPR) repeat protein
MNKKILGLLMFGMVALTGQAYADIETANTAFDAKKYDEAAALYKLELQKENQTKEILSELSWRYGRTLMANDKGEDAYDYLKKAVKRHPKSALVQLWFGNASGNMAGQASMFSALGYAKECKRGFTKAVELDPTNILARRSLMSFLLQAPGIAGGDNDEALVHAKAIMELDKIKGYEAMITAHGGRDETKEALSFADAYIAEYPILPDAYFTRAIFNGRSKKYEVAYQDFMKTIELGKAAIETETDDKRKDALKEITYTSMYQVGRVAVVGKIRRAEGIAALTEVIELNEFEEVIERQYSYYRLGQLYIADGNRRMAAASISKGLKDIENKDLKKKLLKIKKKLRKMKKS